MNQPPLPIENPGEELCTIVQKIRAISMYEKLISNEKPSWEDFQKNFMLSIRVQKLFYELHHFFRSLYSLRVRDLLVAYLLVFYEIDTSDTFEEVKRVSDAFLTCLHTAPLDTHFYTQVYTHIHQYERVYIPWKMDDCEKVLETLTRMYWEYEINWRLYASYLASEEKERLLEEKNTRQAECISTMEKIDKLCYFHQFQPVYVDSSTSRLLQDILRTAFWDRVKESLLEDPPQFASLFSIFQEIQDHIQAMTKSRPDILTIYQEVMDVEFMKQIQEHGYIETSFWVHRIEYLVDVLIQLDSAEREPFHLQQKDTFLQAISQNAIDTHTIVHTCIDILAYITIRMIEIREVYDRIIEPV